jgi:hypothetical protein
MTNDEMLLLLQKKVQGRDDFSLMDMDYLARMATALYNRGYSYPFIHGSTIGVTKRFEEDVEYHCLANEGRIGIFINLHSFRATNMEFYNSVDIEVVGQLPSIMGDRLDWVKIRVFGGKALSIHDEAWFLQMAPVFFEEAKLNWKNAVDTRNRMRAITGTPPDRD